MIDMYWRLNCRYWNVRRFLWRALVMLRYLLTSECGLNCGYTEPYGFVPEADCPIHDWGLKSDD